MVFSVVPSRCGHDPGTDYQITRGSPTQRRPVAGLRSAVQLYGFPVGGWSSSFWDRCRPMRAVSQRHP
jgi:hypothetical protein